jgi:OHCU decarboxylase
MTLADLNAADRSRFVAHLGSIFEDSPWVAERTWPRRPFASAEDLYRAMVAEVSAAARAEQLALLRAHPDLGARARMSDASIGEQAGAGLDRLTPEAFETLRRLNAAYRDKFAFPFLLAVRGRTTHEVLDALASRLSATPEAEFAEALQQVYRIARFRLEAAVSPPAQAGYRPQRQTR